MIYLGTSGWYYEHGEGPFYPEALAKKAWLAYYAQRFSTVEVNASFYRMPTRNIMQSWYERTPDDLVLAFKGSQVMTYRKKLRDGAGYLARFYERISLAQEKLGPVLWQLPPFMERDDGLLESFLTVLDSEVPQAIEFRHESWLCPPVLSLLEDYGIAFCIVSCPDFEPLIEVTASFAYIRWHGRKEWYRSQYTQEELAAWADRIRALQVETVYGYFNNDARGYAPADCAALRQLVEASPPDGKE